MGAAGAKRAPLQLERARILVPLHESVRGVAILFRTTARTSNLTERHSSATGRTLSVAFTFSGLPYTVVCVYARQWLQTGRTTTHMSCSPAFQLIATFSLAEI